MDVAFPPDVLQVRAPGLNFYVLRDATSLYLLDGGFVGGRFLLHRALRKSGWDNVPIRGIIVTHGHLDHILNVSRIARATGAWIAAPRLDADHFSGHPHYEGWAKITGSLETLGRPFLGFRPFAPDRWLDDGDLIDVWHGLRAVHLPGHTHGHMGFYCESLKLLFSADLFASYRELSRAGPLPAEYLQLPSRTNTRQRGHRAFPGTQGHSSEPRRSRHPGGTSRPTSAASAKSLPNLTTRTLFRTLYA